MVATIQDVLRNRIIAEVRACPKPLTEIELAKRMEHAKKGSGGRDIASPDFSAAIEYLVSNEFLARVTEGKGQAETIVIGPKHYGATRLAGPRLEIRFDESVIDPRFKSGGATRSQGKPEIVNIKLPPNLRKPKAKVRQSASTSTQPAAAESKPGPVAKAESKPRQSASTSTQPAAARPRAQAKGITRPGLSTRVSKVLPTHPEPAIQLLPSAVELLQAEAETLQAAIARSKEPEFVYRADQRLTQVQAAIAILTEPDTTGQQAHG